MENKILEWALKYIKHGFSVIPVGENKVPLIEWKKYQNEIASEEQVKEWFDKENPPNIGIVTGKISNITVVDVEKGGKWEHYPRTMTAKSGGGGVHLYYKYADGVGNSARIKELTDIRGNGGYVVCPPSKHASGKEYEWIAKEAPQPFPYQVFNLSPEKPKNDWSELLKGVSSGQRNNDASKVIGKFLTVVPIEEWQTTAWSMFVVWNQSNTPPLVERELRAVFNSIVGREIRSGKHGAKVVDDDVGIKLISEIAKDITDDMTVSYPTGYKIFDNSFMGGLKEGDLIFLTGYSGHGKTVFAQSVTYNLDKVGVPCLWFSFEVPIGELWRKFKDMGVSENFMAYSPEKIVSNNIEWVKDKIIKARDAFKTKIIFIDHLGFLATDPKNYDANISNNYSTVLTMICRQLKTIAIAENVAIVLLGHVRKPMTGRDIDPTIHDIKDSSGVAQESDGVLIINRKKRKFSDDGGLVGEVFEPTTTVKIEKNRRTGQNKFFSVIMDKGRLVDTDSSLDNF